MNHLSLLEAFFRIVNTTKKDNEEYAAEHGYDCKHENETYRAAAGRIVANPDLYDFVINPPLADRNEYHGHPALNPIVICQNGEFSTYPILLPLEYSDLAGRVVGDAILDNWWRLYDMSDPVKAKGIIKNWETDICVEDVGKELFYIMGEIVDLIPLPDGKTFAEHGYNALEHVVALYLIGLNIPVFEFFDLIDEGWL